MNGFTVLEQSDEQYAPPEKDILRVSVMGPDVYLDICTMEDDHKGTTLAPKASAIVPIAALVAALGGGAITEEALRSSPQRRCEASQAATREWRALAARKGGHGRAQQDQGVPSP